MQEQLDTLIAQISAIKTQIGQLEQLGAFRNSTQEWQLKQARLTMKRLNEQRILLLAEMNPPLFDDIPF